MRRASREPAEQKTMLEPVEADINPVELAKLRNRVEQTEMAEEELTSWAEPMSLSYWVKTGEEEGPLWSW